MSWPVTTIDDIKSRERYSCVGGPFGSDLTGRDYVSEGVPVIRGSNLPAELDFLDDGFVFVSAEKAAALRANTAAPGDLVFTQRGTLGQVGLIPLSARFPEYVISQSQMKLRVDPSRVDPRFLYYFFRHPNTVQQVISRAITSGVPHINLSILKAFCVPCPPLRDQLRVVSVLASFDNLIANNRRRVALLEQVARLIYEEWFVRLRFPGHEGVRVVAGVPEGWARVRLDTIADVNAETLPGSFDGEIQYVDIASVSPGQIDGASTLDFRDAPSRARRPVRPGDILWSCVRPNRRSHALAWAPPANMVASTGFAVIRATHVPATFLYQAVTTDGFVGYLENHARGAAYPAVVAADFERADVLRPPEKIVQAYDKVAGPMAAQREGLMAQSEKLRAARDLLLPRLMSGEVIA